MGVENNIPEGWVESTLGDDFYRITKVILKICSYERIVLIYTIQTFKRF